ncbi:MAG: hypothetical protein ACI8XG_000867 [Congregibacter sp.]|jgi:hypothetical protein
MAASSTNSGYAGVATGLSNGSGLTEWALIIDVVLKS